ncbi:guanine nucleotide-binding protein alpha-4 subunit-related [Anaeramoeba ignava]|uniref:Guanine nucleotide-binding protein alpha-4 subunit-related n=1 Tax=Anaeramoeba ignava TaxID=1746090 RepID=A0A9Q0LM50_ANAIG|nr:guanine nucleotide-binding protein alpha-4 subunit-related [Anaeramoeba ignava]
MGNCSKNPDFKSKEIERNKLIQKLIDKDSNSIQKEQVRILLLGTGESGKSTFFKQMKLIQNKNFDEKTLNSFKPTIFSNALSQMKILCVMADQLGIPVENDEVRIKFLDLKRSDMQITPQIAMWINTLWKDPGIQSTFKMRKRKFQINDSASYFFDNIERISKPDYLPTNEDVIRARSTTRSIQEAQFEVFNFKFRLVDVGGQQNERRKWISLFDDSSSIIFFVSLIDYCLQLREDPRKNRLVEALDLFADIVNSPWFEKTSIIIFFNKMDLLKESLEEIPFSSVFPEYEGPNDFENTTEFIKKQFLQTKKHEGESQQIYPFLTCAVDTENISNAFKIAIDNIYTQALDDLDF